MRIHENTAALNARRNLAHDRPGLVRSEQLRARIGGLRTASEATQAALSFVQTAEGGLIEVHAALQRLRELTVAVGNLGTSDGDALRALQTEIDHEVQAIDRIAADTRYGTVALLDGSFAAPTPAVFEVGGQPRQRLEVVIDAVDAATLGVDELHVASRDPPAVAAALEALDRAITATSTSRAELGALHDWLRATVRNLDNAREHLKAAESRIRDTDLALASIEQARNVILLATGTPMLAAAQRVPDTVHELLGLPP